MSFWWELHTNTHKQDFNVKIIFLIHESWHWFWKHSLISEDNNQPDSKTTSLILSFKLLSLDPIEYQSVYMYAWKLWNIIKLIAHFLS